MIDFVVAVAGGVLVGWVRAGIDRGRPGWAGLGAVGGGLGIAVGAAVATADPFTVVRAAAWLTFVHLPLGLVTLAVSYRGWVRWASLAAAALGAAIGVDAFLIEPHALEVVRYEVRDPSLPQRVRVVVLSDVQTDRVGPYEQRVFERAMAEAPDLVVLPGDYLQTAHDQVPAWRALVSRLHAPLGVWAVRGNVERDGWERELFDGTGVRALGATTTTDLGPLWLTGLSFDDGFDPALVVPERPGFHLVFGHGPDFSLSPDVRADLLVAGHTHGGQVQLPWLGPPVVLSRVSREVGAGGRFDLPDGRTVVVSRGIGMERRGAPRLRFRCRPQLVVIDLAP